MNLIQKLGRNRDAVPIEKGVILSSSDPVFLPSSFHVAAIGPGVWLRGVRRVGLRFGAIVQSPERLSNQIALRPPRALPHDSQIEQRHDHRQAGKDEAGQPIKHECNAAQVGLEQGLSPDEQPERDEQKERSEPASAGIGGVRHA